MKFEPNCVYHVFNQGNNRSLVFFSESHYTIFIEKMKEHITPFAHILAYCLMPNHFHILLKTKPQATEESNGCRPMSIFENENFVFPDLNKSDVQQGSNLIKRQKNLNHSIGRMLSSYSKKINTLIGRTGSLFRNKTKAKSGLEEPKISFVDGTQVQFWPMEIYWQTCFDYIHNNPVEANLSKTPEEWSYSSAAEFKWPAKDDLVNHELVAEMGLIDGNPVKKLIFSDLVG